MSKQSNAARLSGWAISVVNAQGNVATKSCIVNMQLNSGKYVSRVLRKHHVRKNFRQEAQRQIMLGRCKLRADRG